MQSSASNKVEQPRTLLERWLNPKGSNPSEKKNEDPDALPNSKSESTLVLGSDGWRPMMKPKANPEAEKELDEAQKLFQQGNLAEAETAYKQIAKKRKGTQWGEKALYYVAECQYQQRKYVKANDSFEKLVADHPGTQYLDKLVSREYSMAQLWLAQSDPKARPQDQLSWFTRFTGEQPLLDTRGTGLKALEHVRSHDPEGPLADDALLQIADAHTKSADYESAAIYYDQLISTYEKSPFLQKAQLASIDARLKGYMGPDYDGAGLEKARDMVKQTMATFPDRQASYEGLFHTLDIINDQEAERTFHVGAFYKRVGKVTSAEYYFGKIPQRWPNSPWAVKAKTELAQLAKMPRKPSMPSKILSSPGSNDPYYSAGGGGGMGGMGGMGMGGMGGMGAMTPGMN
jgi:outer membrane protein assembly factor BamD (BamD/ComL family)